MNRSADYAYLCNGADSSGIEESADVTSLHYIEGVDDEAELINLGLPKFVRQIQHIPDRLLDLLEIAAYVFSADRLSYRGSTSAVEFHRWSDRSFEYNIRIRDYDFWRREDTVEKLRDAIEFLSGDRAHDFSFQGGHSTPSVSLFDKEEFQPSASEDTSIILFSGGLDSLTGAVQRLENSDDDVLLVSHWSQYQIRKTQRSLVEALQDRYPDRVSWYRFRCMLRRPLKSKEETQCTRSFLFSSIAFSLAQTLGIKRFYLYENGVTGINLPRREDLMHARASRTTHPKTISHFTDLFNHVSNQEDSFSILNPFQWKTKAEVLDLLVNKYSQGSLLSSAVSCGVVRDTFDTNVTHCGKCSQCVDRRFAAFAANCDNLDDRGIYDTDIVNEKVESDGAQKTLVDYIRSSLDYANSSIDQFYSKWSYQLTNIVTHVQGSEKEVVRKVYSLHKRHGDQVVESIEEMRTHEDITTRAPRGSVLYVVNERHYLGDKDSSLISMTDRLEDIEPGKDQFQDFEDFVEEFISKLFPNDLIDSHSQVNRGGGAGTIDITFLNASESGFWSFVKNAYNAVNIPVEAKNTNDLEVDDIRQIFDRLSPESGEFGLIVSRDKNSSDIRQVRDKINGGTAVILSEDDLIDMAKMKMSDNDPAQRILENLREIQQGM